MKDDSFMRIEQERQSGSLRDFLTVLFKHKSTISVVWIATVAAVTAGTFLLPPTYEAQSTLLVKFGREFTYRPEVSDKAPVIAVNQEEAINSEINIITSRDLVERVINKLQVGNIYPELLESHVASIAPLDAAIINFSKKLNVEVIKKSNVLRVSFQHKDPQIAARAVNLLVDYYKERHFQVYNGPESQFLEKQLSVYQQKLKDSEDSLQAFKQKNQVYSLDEQLALLLKQRTELDASLKVSQSLSNSLRKRLFTLNSRLKHLGEVKGRYYTQSERDRIIVEAKAQLLNLRLKERDLLEKYPETNGLVVNVRKNIAMVTRYLQQQEEDISSKVNTSNAVLQEAEKESLVTEANLNSELAKEVTLRQQLNLLDVQIKALDSNEKPLQTLKREVSTNDRNYRNYLDRFEEAHISDVMTRQKLANLSVIQVAKAPAKAIKPKKLLNILLGAILGAVFGLGYAIVSEYFNQALSTPEDAQKRLGLPVLAAIELKE